MLLRTAAGLAVALALTSCGTTVPLAGSGGAVSAPDGTGLAPQGSGLQGTVDLGSPAAQAPVAGPSSEVVTGTPQAVPQGSSAAPVPGRTTGSTVLAPGGPVKVGVAYVDQGESSAFTAAIGAGLETGDAKANFTALVKALNAKGGILGRKVELVFHKLDTSQTISQMEQGACTDFTQDHEVTFVLSQTTPTLAKCLISRGLAVVGGGGQVNTADYEKLRYFVQPYAFALDRLAGLQASEFHSMGLFKGSTPAKVGVLFYDAPEYKAAEQVLVKGLRARGVEVMVEEAFYQFQSTADLSRTQAQVQSAVLKFKAAGITHVLGVELNAWLQGFFALYGSQQDYYPRYGWTSNQVPTNAQAVVPHRALERSLVLGFYPTYDTEDQKSYPAATKRCFATLQSQGVQITSGNQRADAVTACDTVDYLKAALTTAGGLTREALVTGAVALGRSFAHASTYASLLPKGYGAGINAIRPGAWNLACDCFAYTGKPRPLA